MSIRKGLAKAFAMARKQRGLVQEDFSDVSSRTYVSGIERGMKSPTVEKLEQLASVIEVRAATLIVLATSIAEGITTRELLECIQGEIENLSDSPPSNGSFVDDQ